MSWQGSLGSRIVVSVVATRWHALSQMIMFNSLAPGKFEWNFRYLIFKIILVIDGWGISCEFALRWMSLNLTADKPTLLQVMAWCCQATSHYLSQCWPRSLSPYGITRPQWVNYRNWYQYWGHCCLINDLGSSPQPEGEARALWWASQVVNETTMTAIEVSISILSWWK